MMVVDIEYKTSFQPRAQAEQNLGDNLLNYYLDSGSCSEGLRWCCVGLGAPCGCFCPDRPIHGILTS